MMFCSRLSSRLLTCKEHARFLENRQWLQGLLKDFSVENVLGVPQATDSPCVMIYGSCVAGTSFQDGDADYAVVFPLKSSVSDFGPLEKLKISPVKFLDVEREHHKNVLSSILGHIERRNLSVELKFERIFAARVPIVRIKKLTNNSADSIRFDLSLSLDGLRNSLLIRLYMESDPRLRAGALYAKLWGRSQKILDARRGWISPYALTVMYIYYMQVTGRTTSVIDERKVDELISLAAMQLSRDISVESSQFYEMLPCQEVVVSEVLDDLRGFFGFFGDFRQFDFDSDVVDIRTQNKWLSKEQWLNELKQSGEKERWELLGYEMVMVRDPYEPHNLGRSVDFFRAEDIREMFRLASDGNSENLLSL
ncbi:putative RNA polymerase II [Trypanosoma grayi]|uniref:putative RNA polymerase II n=1 Tax=Trypanosoma grayi TaxID=71804 RepID=UPI0004F429AE|nr:putative RNA polymerase II [Trypanosoma grayi]KEG11972.1 putative RNA polymerase II [Trypanosoma grayi]